MEPVFQAGYVKPKASSVIAEGVSTRDAKRTVLYLSFLIISLELLADLDQCEIKIEIKRGIHKYVSRLTSARARSRMQRAATQVSLAMQHIYRQSSSHHTNF